MGGTFWILTLISQRNSVAEERLERLGRPKSLVDLEMSATESTQRFSGLRKAFEGLGASMESGSDLEKNSLKVRLANAGFRSESAASVYQGLRVATLLVFLVPAALF